MNYYVLIGGTTSVVNSDYSPKQAFKVISKYYSPAVITGRVTDPLNDNISGVTVKVNSGISTNTNSEGFYTLVVPSESVSLNVNGDGYSSASAEIKVLNNRSEITHDFVITPTKPGIIYKIRTFLHNIRFPFF